MDYAALGVKVETLESDFREVKTSIASLDGKIDRAISNLSQEVRSAMNTLHERFAEHNKTPWAAISGVGGVMIVIFGAFIGQALNPIWSDLKMVKDSMVPRVEHDYRQHVVDEKFHMLESYNHDEVLREVSRLEAENRYLRKQELDNHKP